MWEGLNKHSFVKMLPSRGLTSRYMLFLIIFSVHQLNPGSGVALDTRSRWEKSEGLNGKVGSFVSILALNATRLIIQFFFLTRTGLLLVRLAVEQVIVIYEPVINELLHVQLTTADNNLIRHVVARLVKHLLRESPRLSLEKFDGKPNGTYLSTGQSTRPRSLG